MCARINSSRSSRRKPSLSAPRLNWFYLTAPLLMIIAGGIARRAGFRWAQSNEVMVAL
jgi:hypothetical protein